MGDYVERQFVLKLIKNRREKYSYGNGGNQILFDTLRYIEKKVNKEDCSSVHKIKQGVWEPGNPNCPICGENKFKDMDADIWADWQPPYCPNCGAMMTGE